MCSLKNVKEAEKLLDSISGVVKREYNGTMYLVVRATDHDSAVALRVLAMIKVFALVQKEPVFHDPIVKVTRANPEPSCILEDEVWLKLSQEIISIATKASFYVMIDNNPVRSFDQVIEDGDF